MLLSGLDEAPISTIDAFLSQLVQPYIDLVALYPSNQQVSEERKPIMVQDTLHAVWRIRSVEDAGKRGCSITTMPSSKHGIVWFVVWEGKTTLKLFSVELLDRSLFVEQSHRSMIQRAEAMGLPWSGRGPAPVEVLLNTIAEPVEGLLPDFTANLHMYLTAWLQEFLPYRAQCIAPAEAEEPLTRFNHLTRLMSQPVPTQPGEQLTWVWKALLGIATASGLVKPTCSFFPRICFQTETVGRLVCSQNLEPKALEKTRRRTCTGGQSIASDRCGTI